MVMRNICFIENMGRENRMKRQAPKKNKRNKLADTIVILLVFAIPFTVSHTDGTGFFEWFGRGAAAMAMPEAGVSAFMEEMRAAMDGEDNDQPGYYVEVPPPEKEEPAISQSDYEQACALIPEENRGPIETIQYDSNPSGDNFFDFCNGTARNATGYSTAEMLDAAAGALPFNLELYSTQPQVLIMHTHSTESYDRFDAGFYDVTYPYRLTDINENVNAVGKVMAELLNSLGINTVQATEYHDYPSYNNSYSRSRVTVQKYLGMYPDIKIVLDIHRDGIEREDGTRLKPTAVINGKKAAQIMIIVGVGDSEYDVPNFRENLKFGMQLQNSAETMYPGLTRPLYLANRFYNQDLTAGSILIEMGGHANTLKEAKYAGELVARSLANLLQPG